MDFKQIKCYLCGKDAQEYSTRGNLWIKPSYDFDNPCECGFYRISDRVIQFRMDKMLMCVDKDSRERIPLTKEQKEFLAKFVQDNQHDEWEKTAMITTEIMDESCKTKS